MVGLFFALYTSVVALISTGLSWMVLPLESDLNSESLANS